MMTRKKKRTNDRGSRITRRVESALELPSGTLSGVARIELSGRSRAVVEGCQGILEYQDDVIRLNTASGIVRFMGRQLGMNGLSEDNAVIEGQIVSVEFLS